MIYNQFIPIKLLTVSTDGFENLTLYYCKTSLLKYFEYHKLIKQLHYQDTINFFLVKTTEAYMERD